MKVIIVGGFDLAMNKIMSNPDKQIFGVINKERALDNPKVIGSIESGFEIAGAFIDMPKVGERFNIAHKVGEDKVKLFSTSPIAEIIYATDMEVKFKTDNSIYLLVTPK